MDLYKGVGNAHKFGQGQHEDGGYRFLQDNTRGPGGSNMFNHKNQQYSGTPTGSASAFGNHQAASNQPGQQQNDSSHYYMFSQPAQPAKPMNQMPIGMARSK